MMYSIHNSLTAANAGVAAARTAAGFLRYRCFNWKLIAEVTRPLKLGQMLMDTES
jgi:hypothetical protein